MTRLNNNRILNSLREMGRRVSFPTAVLVMVVGMTAGATQAQDPEVGNNGGWRAEKTVEDYMNPADGSSAKRTDADFDYAGNTLRTEVWVDKSEGEIYSKGQDIGVGFETNQDAYAVVYRIDTDGLVTVLWPRSRFDDGFVFGSHEYQLPVSGARKLRVSNSEGQGIVEALVSQYPFDLRALELDFHHEVTAERHDFRVAGDPFLAMNEVNFAVTGLEDSGEYVVTNFASYYVHQEVDHPRYLCNQCHIEDEVAYDPYRDDCTLNIEYDYSWYNGWYDNYGYYPVYGNPVYVYIDPWNYNPWVNYWYRPYYSCAPWYGWGWGYGGCYSWSSSPYYYGDCVTVYSGGNTRYRPLDRSRVNDRVTKTREYNRGSEMVRKNSLSSGERGAMESRTRGNDQRADRSTTVGRSSGRDVAYRGAKPASRTRSTFVQSSSSGRSQGGLRIRETGVAGGASRGTTTEASRRRHTAAGDGNRAGLVPVTRSSRSNDDWRGTTRVGGSSGTRGSSNNSPTTVGNSRNTGSSSGNSSSGVQNSRSRSSGTSKTVQPRKRSTRVWNSTGSESGSTRESRRSRSGTVDKRRRSDSSTESRSSGRSGSSSTVRPRSNSKSSGGSAVRPRSNSKSSGGSEVRPRSNSKSSSSKSKGRSSGTVNKRSKSSSSSSSSSGGSRSSSSNSGGSSRSSSGGGSSKSSGRSGSSRR